MYNGLGLTKGFSFVKILGGLSKTLQVANQIIPLYQKAKPAIHNARNMLNIIKEIKKPDTTLKNESPKQITNTSFTSKVTKEKTSDAPTFFL